MKIHILRGSPHLNGCSNLLADSFIRGAKEYSHVITETDAAHIHITPCTGCKACNFSGQPCRIKDDMTEVITKAVKCRCFYLPKFLSAALVYALLRSVLNRCPPDI